MTYQTVAYILIGLFIFFAFCIIGGLIVRFIDHRKVKKMLKEVMKDDSNIKR